jgi:hypothetical protein
MSVEFRIEGRPLKWRLSVYKDGVLSMAASSVYWTRLSAENACKQLELVYKHEQRRTMLARENARDEERGVK